MVGELDGDIAVVRVGGLDGTHGGAFGAVVRAGQDATEPPLPPAPLTFQPTAPCWRAMAMISWCAGRSGWR